MESSEQVMLNLILNLVVSVHQLGIIEGTPTSVAHQDWNLNPSSHACERSAL